MNTPTIDGLLVNYLKLSKASKTVGFLIYVMLETREQKLAMCEFLDENPDATEQEIAQAATGILDRFPSENEDDL